MAELVGAGEPQSRKFIETKGVVATGSTVNAGDLVNIGPNNEIAKVTEAVNLSYYMPDCNIPFTGGPQDGDVCEIRSNVFLHVSSQSTSLLQAYVQACDTPTTVVGSVATKAQLVGGSAAKPRVAKIKDDLAVMMWREGTKTYVCAVNIAGLTVTFGASVEVSNYSGDRNFEIIPAGASKFVILYSISNTTTAVKVGTVSGTIITLGSESASASVEIIELSYYLRLSDNTFLIAAASRNGTNGLRVFTVTVSGDSASIGNITTISVAASAPYPSYVLGVVWVGGSRYAVWYVQYNGTFNNNTIRYYLITVNSDSSISIGSASDWDGPSSIYASSSGGNGRANIYPLDMAGQTFLFVSKNANTTGVMIITFNGTTFSKTSFVEVGFTGGSFPAQPMYRAANIRADKVIIPVSGYGATSKAAPIQLNYLVCNRKGYNGIAKTAGSAGQSVTAWKVVP